MPGGRQTRFLSAGDKDVQPGQAQGSDEGGPGTGLCQGWALPALGYSQAREVPGSLPVPRAPHPGPLQRPG